MALETMDIQAGEEWTAEGLINTAAVEDGSASDAFIGRLEEEKTMLEAAERAKIDEYISGIRPAIEGVLVEPLEAGVGGEYDGSDITIAQSTLLVHSSIRETIDQAQETRDHEEYHEENGHTEPLLVMAETKGDIAAVIGGVAFTETALIEGLTVKQTGDQFVSTQYVEYEGMIDRAMDNSHLTLEEIEQAVNREKDVTLIDDRDRVKNPEETHYALAS